MLLPEEYLRGEGRMDEDVNIDDFEVPRSNDVVDADPTVTNWPQYNTVALVYINWKKVEE